MATELVDKARSIESGHVNKPVTKDQEDLVLAWASGDVTLTQAAVTLGISRNAFYQRAAIAFKSMIKSGRLHGD